MKKLMAGLAVTLALSATAQDSTVQAQAESNPLNFSGFIEGYYCYDFNKPEDNTRPGFLYSHNRHHEFNVNLAFLKGSYNTDRVRANLTLAVGTYMNANYAAEPGVLKNIYEANAGYKLNRNQNLWFDIGIMPSHIGWESAHAPSCWTLTRSIAAENSPYYESGAKLTYNTNDGKWLFSALALNGWQRIQRVDSNSLMSWGTQVQFKPSDKVLINYSTFFGTDKPDAERKWRYFHDLYAILQLTDKIGVIAGLDYGQEQKVKDGDDKSDWFTPVGIVRFTPNDHWAMALRGEYYSDEDGVIISTGTPNGFKTAGFSANVDYWPMKNISLRLEGRTLNSKDEIFVKEGISRDNNTAITFSTAINF
ncbi:porin [Chitinophagaceae bacterium LB-8]|uniref:Porin n=1 Tax=Paraflavisolibacter caeni TaxID=2982496 RepID=A0A9X3BHP1_9BACT|nr:porin [Paraflavisolibacter caeni]MCU7548933.1 porin [Paraflavisolibacter caeni]